MMVEMSDGVKLSTYVYFPAGKGPWPVLLTRNPYPSSNQNLGDIAQIFNRYGYAVVVQDVRGTGQSEGEWNPFANDRKDGLDTLEWLTRQEWMDGNIGMFGHSYLAFTQWIIADQLPQEVKTLYMTAFGTERYRQMYNNGMFRPDIYTLWTMSNAGVPPIVEDPYWKALWVRPHVEMDKEIFGVELPWYREWVTTVSPESDFWKNGMWAELQRIPEKVDIPVFLAVGWYDHHLEGMIYAYNNLPKSVKEQSRFIIGPWNHSMVGAGDLDYPNNQILGTSQIKAQLEWFDHHLKGKPYPYKKGVIETYNIRQNEWMIWNQNRTNKKKFYLTPGKLDTKPSGQEYSISYEYDPNDPVPTKGAESVLNSALYAGPRLQDPPGSRADVISFISEPLKEDLTINGNIKVNLSLSSDAEDTAFTIKVMEVFPNGETYNIRNGITSLAYRNGATTPKSYTPGDVIEVSIETWPITWTLKKGSRIRLDISSSNFPEYMAHSNMAGIWALQKDVKIAHQTIYMGKNHKSYLEIPAANIAKKGNEK